MNKLPIGTVAWDSVLFGFRNIFTTIRLGWLGFLLFAVVLAAGCFVFLGGFIEAIEVLEAVDDGDFDPEHWGAIHDIMGAYGGLILMCILASLVFVPFAVVMTRMAGGTQEAPSGIAYFKFGGNEIRYVLASILSTILHLIVMFLAFLPMIIVFALGIAGVAATEAFMDPEIFADAFEDGMAGLAGVSAILLFIVGIVLIVWFSIRMIAFLPSVANDERIDLGAAVKMTKSNVWHIIGGGILFFLMLWAAELAFTLLMFVGAAIVGVTIGAMGGEIEILAIVLGGLGGLGAILLVLFYIAFVIGAEIAFPAQVYKHLRDNA